MASPTHMRQSAGVLLWRQGVDAQTGIDDLEVYVVKCSPTSGYMANFWVLPRGANDALDGFWPGDDTSRGATHCAIATAARALIEKTGLGFCLVRRDTGAPVPCNLLKVLRQHALSGAKMFYEGIKTFDVALDERHFVGLGLWIAPPCVSRPTSAHYYAVRCDDSETIDLHAKELSQGMWASPMRLLQMHAANSMVLAWPVILMLQQIIAHANDVAVAAQMVRLEAGAHKRNLVIAQPVPDVWMMPVKSPTLAPYTHTNTYVVGQKDLVVIDPGTPYDDELQRLFFHLDRFVAEGKRIKDVWLTHFHVDHTGGAEAIRQRYHAKVWAHRLTDAQLIKTSISHTCGALKPLAIDGFIEDEQKIDVGTMSLTALHTPGHALGHLCFVDNEHGHIFCGDNILGAGTTVVGPRPDGGLNVYLQSLERLCRKTVGVLLPGHGPPVAEGKKRILEVIAHRHKRHVMLRELIGQHASPIGFEEIVARLYHGLAKSLAGLAELTTQAHLEKLVDDHEVKADAQGRYTSM